MIEDEDRHADEVNIAFQMGAEWERARTKARIEKLEAALYEIVHINNMRDRFSSEIDNVITTVLGEKDANA
jgi:hypothetical protein